MQLADAKQSIDEARDALEQAKMKCHSTELQREAASRREAQLQAELSSVHMKLEDSDTERTTLKQQVQLKHIHSNLKHACQCRIGFDVVYTPVYTLHTKSTITFNV